MAKKVFDVSLDAQEVRSHVPDTLILRLKIGTCTFRCRFRRLTTLTAQFCVPPCVSAPPLSLSVAMPVEWLAGRNLLGAGRDGGPDGQGVDARLLPPPQKSLPPDAGASCFLLAQAGPARAQLSLHSLPGMYACPSPPGSPCLSRAPRRVPSLRCQAGVLGNCAVVHCSWPVAL